MSGNGNQNTSKGGLFVESESAADIALFIEECRKNIGERFRKFEKITKIETSLLNGNVFDIETYVLGMTFFKEAGRPEIADEVEKRMVKEYPILGEYPVLAKAVNFLYYPIKLSF